MWPSAHTVLDNIFACQLICYYYSKHELHEGDKEEQDEKELCQHLDKQGAEFLHKHGILPTGEFVDHANANMKSRPIFPAEPAAVQNNIPAAGQVKAESAVGNHQVKNNDAKRESDVQVVAGNTDV
jgi:hypothetical protein